MAAQPVFHWSSPTPAQIQNLFSAAPLASKQSPRRKRCLWLLFRLGRWGLGEGVRFSSPSFAHRPSPAENLNKVFSVWLEMLEEESSNRSRAGMRAVAAAAAAASGTVASGEEGGVSLARSPSKPEVSFWPDSWNPFSDPNTKLANLESPRDLRD